MVVVKWVIWDYRPKVKFLVLQLITSVTWASDLASPNLSFFPCKMEIIKVPTCYIIERIKWGKHVAQCPSQSKLSVDISYCYWGRPGWRLASEQEFSSCAPGAIGFTKMCLGGEKEAIIHPAHTCCPLQPDGLVFVGVQHEDFIEKKRFGRSLFCSSGVLWGHREGKWSQFSGSWHLPFLLHFLKQKLKYQMINLKRYIPYKT